MAPWVAIALAWGFPCDIHALSPTLIWQVRVADVAAPVAGAGQVLLQTVRCGICGSDLHARTHCDELADVAAEIGYRTAMRADQEIVFGHEICGRILDYGPRTRKHWQTGALAVAIPLRKNGDTVHMIGFDTASPGAYAEQVIVQEAFTFPVPNGLPAEKAAFTEPLAVAFHAVRRGAVRKGQVAVVIGCGPIGLAVILMLKAAGVRTVVASDFSPGRRALASRCGADVVVDPAEFRGTLHMIAEGKIDPSPLLTGTVGLDGVSSAFTALGDPEKHAKILIDPSSRVTAP
jgi:threonine dehydrogenase-like Zn-dependent dehydrogenase